MRFDQLQPRGWNLDFQLVPLRQFQHGKRFEHTEYRRLVHKTFANFTITVITRLKRKAKGSRSHPKPLVIHRAKPFFDVVYVSELSHEVRISKLNPTMQKTLQRECRI